MSEQHSLRRFGRRVWKDFKRRVEKPNKRIHYEQAAEELFDLCRSPALSIDGIENALSFHPLAFAARDINDKLPLHVVCGAFKSGGGSADVVEYLLKLYPDSVCEQNCYRDLPLHVACGGGAPLQVVQRLYEQTQLRGCINKEMWDKIGLWTPLHSACTGGCSLLEVIRYLVKEYRGILKQHPIGEVCCTPLHLACGNGAATGVIKYLVEQWPNVVRLCDSSGRLPLHKACYVRQSLQLEDIQCLVEEWPESLQEKEHERGATPLHCACGKKTSVGIVQYLLEQWPEAVRIKDCKGRLPLQNACMGTESYGRR